MNHTLLTQLMCKPLLIQEHTHTSSPLGLTPIHVPRTHRLNHQVVAFLLPQIRTCTTAQLQPLPTPALVAHHSVSKNRRQRLYPPPLPNIQTQNTEQGPRNGPEKQLQARKTWLQNASVCPGDNPKGRGPVTSSAHCCHHHLHHGCGIG